jgi:hypothetical protein
MCGCNTSYYYERGKNHLLLFVNALRQRLLLEYIQYVALQLFGVNLCGEQLI